MMYNLADQYAFPAEDEVSYQPGMTLRQYYAGQVMVGLLSCPRASVPVLCAREAVLFTDALIAELEKGGAA